jgi:hypothetical protein
MRGLELRHDRVEIRLRFRVGDAVPETRDGRDAWRRRAVRQNRRAVERQRRPEIPLEVENREFELGWHDAHNLAGTAVDHDLPPHDRWIPAKQPLPEAMADDHDVWCAGTAVVRHERAAPERRNAEQGEHVGRHVVGLNALGPIPARQVCAPIGVDRDVFERSCLLLEVSDIRRGEAEANGVLLAVPPEHERNAIGLVIRQRLQHQHVHEAEDRRVRPDAERERRDCRDGESRRATQQPEAIAEILDQRAHESISW